MNASPLITYRDFELSWRIHNKRGVVQNHRLKAGEGFPRTPLGNCLFAQTGLPFLICSKLPGVIQTDFSVSSDVQRITHRMYRRLGRKRPRFLLQGRFDFPNGTQRLDPSRIVVGLSGGKDSVYLLLKCLRQYGQGNVLAVHIANLDMGGVSARERRAVENLASRIGFQLRVVKLTNSARITGRELMRGRDVFLLGMLAVCAVEFGAGNVYTEGPNNAGQVSPETHFSLLPSTYRSVEQFMRVCGAPVRFRASDASAYEVLRRLYIDPEWRAYMPYTHSCFAHYQRMSFCRRCHRTRTPHLADKLYEGECGSCFKCRVRTLCRMLFDPEMESVPREELQSYVERTKAWRENLIKRGESRDFVRSRSLCRAIREVEQKLKKRN